MQKTFLLFSVCTSYVTSVWHEKNVRERQSRYVEGKDGSVFLSCAG
jgi:hypothetical protein